MATCPACLREYTRRKPAQRVCSIECSLKYVTAQKIAAREKARRASDRERKKALKSLTDLAREAQTEVNRWVRLRDKHKPCVSCGQSPYHGQRHAGHYRTRAAAPQLRFNAYNIAAQCSQCNNSKSGNVVEYRKELVNRIGEDRVLAIEHDHSPANFTREYLIRVKEVFRRRTRHLERIRSIVHDDAF